MTFILCFSHILFFEICECYDITECVKVKSNDCIKQTYLLTLY